MDYHCEGSGTVILTFRNTALPPELYTIWSAYPWVFGEPFCVFKIFLSEMTCSASVLTITAFTVERYVAICHPLTAQTMSSLPRAVKSIVSIWACACLSALPYPIHAGTFYFVNYPGTSVPIPDSLQCNIHRVYLSRMMYFIQVSTFILFIIPMTTISVLYMLIGYTLRQSSIARRGTSDVSSGARHSHQSRRAVLKMLVAVVVAFFLCWAPFHSQRLMTTFISDKMWTPILIEIQSILFYISGVLYFVSSTVNPILYNLMSRKYRTAFKYTLCRCFLPPERRLADSRYGGYSERMSNTYVTVTGANSSRYLTAERCASRRLPVSTRRPTRSVTSSTDDNQTARCSSAKKAGSGWRAAWRSRLLTLSSSQRARAGRADVSSNGLNSGCDVTAQNGPSGRQSPPPLPPPTVRAEEVELCDVTGRDPDAGGCQVIRMKDQMRSGTYL